MRAARLCIPDGMGATATSSKLTYLLTYGCIAAQEKPGWAKFYTSPLPEAAAAQAREVERARDCLAQAKAAESQAVSDGSLDDCVAAREQEDAALVATARAEAPRKHPINFAFSPNGTECLSHLADTWHETDETAHSLSDDLVSMYNETSLEASFDALREHQPWLVPVTRLIYGQPCPIWLNRTDGPLRATSVELGAGGVLDSGLPAQEGGWTDAAVEPPHGHAFVRACKGGHQGYPLRSPGKTAPPGTTLSPWYAGGRLIKCVRLLRNIFPGF